MKFQVASSDLLRKLQIAVGVIVPNPVLPITEDFLFILRGNRLDISATNVDTSISTSIEVNGKEDGDIAVPAKILLETLKALPDQPITFAADDSNAISLESSYGKYKLNGDNIADFPTLPEEENVERFSLESAKLGKAINSTIFATSNDELRLAMTGVLMQLDFNKVIFVATDAHKLVKYTIGNLTSENTSSIILPKKALNLVKSALPLEGEVDIAYNQKNAFFSFGDTKIVCRLIDAKYPDYNAVIPVDNPNELTVDRKDFQSSLRRIGIYASKSTNQVLLTMNEEKLTISGKDMDFANEATESINCRYTGESMTMGFNSKIFVELLNNVNTDEAILQMSVPTRAGILVPSTQSEDEHLMMLVMPVLSSY